MVCFPDKKSLESKSPDKLFNESFTFNSVNKCKQLDDRQSNAKKLDYEDKSESQECATDSDIDEGYKGYVISHLRPTVSSISLLLSSICAFRFQQKISWYLPVRSSKQRNRPTLISNTSTMDQAKSQSFGRIPCSLERTHENVRPVIRQNFAPRTTGHHRALRWFRKRANSGFQFSHRANHLLISRRPWMIAPNRYSHLGQSHPTLILARHQTRRAPLRRLLSDLQAVSAPRKHPKSRTL